MSMKKGIILSGALLVVFGIGLAAGLSMPTAQSASDSSGKVYELRTYTTNEGKLDALHSRFSDATIPLFEKHGMTNIAYWTPSDKDNTLVYIISHDSRDAAKANWKAFGTDPEWRKVYKASRSDGALVSKVESVFLESTDYSPMQ